MDADDLVFADIRPNLVADLLRLTALDHFIAVLRVRRLLLHPVRIHVEDAGKILRQRIHVHFILLQLQRIQKNVFHAGGSRQNIHIPVVDCAARGGNAGTSRLVPDGLFLVFIVFDQHQLDQHGCHGAEGQNPQADHQSKDSLPDIGYGDLRILFRTASSLVPHITLLHFFPHPSVEIKKSKNMGGNPDSPPMFLYTICRGL